MDKELITAEMGKESFTAEMGKDVCVGGVLVRPSPEFTLKSNRTRRRLFQELRRNLRDALDSRQITYHMSGYWNALFLETAAVPRALEVLQHVAGVSSVVVVDRVVPAEVEEIVRAGSEVFAQKVEGRRFAVRARRNGQHPFSSRDVEVALGAALRPLAFKVDLTDPEIIVHVDIQGERAYLYTEAFRGLGGLPVGSQGKALVLISGGFDSAVAAWLVMRRGVAVDYLFCNLGGKAYEGMVLQVAKVLADDWSFGTRPQFYSVDFSAVVAEMQESIRRPYWQVVLKRLMYLTGSLIAERRGALALVTGEAIGQVSSQTLKNLRAIEAGSTLPVLRPLLGYDKEEIIRLARRVGTATLSERVREYCALTPEHPVTAACPRVLNAEVARIDLSILDTAVKNAQVYDLRSLSPSDLVTPFLFTETIPDGAEVIDCQSENLYEAWHYPGAPNIDPFDLLKNFHKLDRRRVYVLYCPHGLQSASVAEVMQRAGYEAYSFKGGVLAIKEYLQTRAQGGSAESQGSG
jgi:thiamine biosynthesis protein ThiI